MLAERIPWYPCRVLSARMPKSGPRRASAPLALSGTNLLSEPTPPRSGRDSLTTPLSHATRGPTWGWLLKMPEIVAPAVMIRPAPVDDALLHTHVLVAELDGRMVGHGLVRLIRSRKRRIGRIGLHVDEGFRDRGVARALLEGLLRLADRQRLDRLEVEVLANNAPAIQLYASMGFVTERMDQASRVWVMSRA